MILPRLTFYAFTSLLFIPSVSLAADDKETQNNQENEVLKLETVEVTARGIKEKNLDAPFMVNVIDRKQIEDQSLKDIEGTLRALPGVDIHNGGNAAYSFMWIRGTGSLSHTNLDDSSVDMRIDGVSNGMIGLSRNLLDVEQVEVAKGPQGTLFGQSAEAGVVTVKTYDPQPGFDANVGLSVGSDNLFGMQAMLNMPLSDQFSVRIAAMGEQQDDYVLQRENNQPLNQKKRKSVQMKLRWSDYERNDVVLQLYQDSRDNFMPLALFDVEENPSKMTTKNLPHKSFRKNYGAILKAQHDFNDVYLQSTTAYHIHEANIMRPARFIDGLDALYDSYKVAAAFRPALNQFYFQDKNNRQSQSDDINQFSQELRLTSPRGSDIQWVVGAYFANKQRVHTVDSKRDILKLSPTFVLNADVFNGVIKRNFDSNTKAVFGEITYPLIGELDMISGLRVAHEELKYKANWQPNAVNPLNAFGSKNDEQKMDETFVSGRLGLRYGLSEQWNLYGLYSRGNKMGGFSDYGTSFIQNKADSAYKSSIIDAYEIGSKYASQSGALQLNVALFENAVSNDQISAITYPEHKVNVFNADTLSRGVEFDATWQASTKLQLSASAIYTDAKVTRVEKSNNKTAKNNRVPQVPEISSSAGFVYKTASPLNLLPKAQWFIGSDVRYVGKRSAEADNKIELKDYTLVDAHMGFDSAYGEVKIWGKNLTDKRFKLFMLNAGNQEAGLPSRGISYGLTYLYRY